MYRTLSVASIIHKTRCDTMKVDVRVMKKEWLTRGRAGVASTIRTFEYRATRILFFTLPFRSFSFTLSSFHPSFLPFLLLLLRAGVSERASFCFVVAAPFSLHSARGRADLEGRHGRPAGYWFSNEPTGTPSWMG